MIPIQRQEKVDGAQYPNDELCWEKKWISKGAFFNFYKTHISLTAAIKTNSIYSDNNCIKYVREHVKK
jgi:hypothetical protein